MQKKRNRIEVIHSILHAIKENKNSIRSTPLLRSSNISSLGFSKYLKELMEKDFVKRDYRQKGEQVLLSFRQGFSFP